MRTIKGNMGSDNFGIVAMFAFWASAIGGIALAISWAKSKGQSASNEAIQKSLKKRLDDGELTQEQYEQRLNELEKP